MTKANSMANPKFICPRCNYNTPYSTDMRKHLNNLKKICPGFNNDIVLTERIKEKILTNRSYVVSAADFAQDPSSIPVSINVENTASIINNAENTASIINNAERTASIINNTENVMAVINNVVSNTKGITIVMDNVASNTENILSVMNNVENTMPVTNNTSATLAINNGVDCIVPVTESTVPIIGTISNGNDTLRSNLFDRSVSFKEFCTNIDHISGLSPLATKTRCGKNVWVLYAKSSTNNSRSPIRVIIENGVRKMHLFDFICALTGCGDNVRNEWETLKKKLENAVVKKITIAQAYQFPRLDRSQLAKSDSTVIDIFQATKVAFAIGKRANWFNDRFAAISDRFFGGDLTLADDVKYMRTVQQSIGQVEPDNFLRLWGDEFSHNSTAVRQLQAISNPENIMSEIAPTTGNAIAATEIRQPRSGSRTRSMPRSQSRSGPGIVYNFPITPIYQTREEAYKHIIENMVGGLEILKDLPAAVVISKDDLNGLFMTKAGKTIHTAEMRLRSYVRDLCPGLYQVEPLSAREYPVSCGDLDQVEKAMHLDIRRHNLSANEPIGLVSVKGDVTWPNEVFKVSNIDVVSAQICETVDNYQRGLPIQSSADFHQETASIKLRQIDVDADKEIKLRQIDVDADTEKEIRLRQIDAEKEIKLRQIDADAEKEIRLRQIEIDRETKVMERRAELLKLMLNQGTPHDTIMQIINSVA